MQVEAGRKQRGHFNLIHFETGLRADIYLSGDDQLHHWAMKHRKEIVVDEEIIWLAPVEYVIIRKLEYYREGEGPKHITDIRNMLEVSKNDIDGRLLNKFIATRKLEQTWNSVLNALN